MTGLGGIRTSPICCLPKRHRRLKQPVYLIKFTRIHPNNHRTMPPKKRVSEVDHEESSKKQKVDENGDSEVDCGPPVTLEGSLLSGELLVIGGTNWDLIGRRNVPSGGKNRGGRNLWSPHRMSSMIGVKVRSVASHCAACHSLAIDTDGKVYSWGRNEQGQLGHGDTKRRDNPTLIESLQELNIVEAACGKNHSLVITENGAVYAFGENKMGQLGLGTQCSSVPTPTRIQYKGPAVRRVACGAEFSMMVDVNSNLYSFGCPEYGQLGHNTDGKYFVSSNKMGYSCETKPRRVVLFIEKKHTGQIVPITDADIVDVACGNNHTIALDRKKRVFTWGFGGYGRLGHDQPKDEMVPRLIKMFEGPMRGAEMIAAGSAFTMAFTEAGNLMLWGQNRPTGEAAMYPKNVTDLSGWKVRAIGCCNRSIIVSADNSVISWGPSPTFGELGYGENKPKSSTCPQEMKSMKGTYVTAVAGGYGHCLMIARNDSEEERKLLQQLPEYKPMGNCK